MRCRVSAEDKLRAGLPVTVRDVRPMSVYDVVPPEGRAGIERARTAAAFNRIGRKMDAVVQRLADLREAEEERRRERRRRGR